MSDSPAVKFIKYTTRRFVRNGNTVANPFDPVTRPIRYRQYEKWHRRAVDAQHTFNTCGVDRNSHASLTDKELLATVSAMLDPTIPETRQYIPSGYRITLQPLAPHRKKLT